MNSGVTRTFPLSGPINLSVRIGHGNLAVTAVDDLAEAVVTVTPRGTEKDPLDLLDLRDRIDVAMRGHTLDVREPREGGLADLIGGSHADRGSVDVAVTVASGTAVRLMTVTAGITVVGRTGGADISTGTGPVAVDEVDGDLRLRFGSAQSRVERVCGSAVVRSGSGDAVFGSGSGHAITVRARTGSGDVHLFRAA